MKNSSENSFRSFLSGKVFYIAAAVVVCAVIASAAVSRYTERKLGQILSTTAVSEQMQATKSAEAEKTDVPDERETTKPVTETEAQTTKRQTTTEKKTTAASATSETDYTPVNNGFCLPCDGEIIKKYSPDQPLYSKTMADWRTHDGIDIRTQEGEKIRSVGNGKVTKVISDPMLGYIIEIDYGSFIGRYCSLKQGTGVSIDDIVSIGDEIGEIGTVPIESADEPHLHFEAVRDGKTIDPMLVLPE